MLSYTQNFHLQLVKSNSYLPGISAIIQKTNHIRGLSSPNSITNTIMLHTIASLSTTLLDLQLAYCIANNRVDNTNIVYCQHVDIATYLQTFAHCYQLISS